MSFKNFADLLELFLCLEKLGCSVMPVHCLLTAVLWHLILNKMLLKYTLGLDQSWQQQCRVIAPLLSLSGKEERT